MVRLKVNLKLNNRNVYLVRGLHIAAMGMGLSPMAEEATNIIYLY